MQFNATLRSVQGSSASRRLRRASKVPAIVYGGKDQPANIELDHNELFHALRKEWQKPARIVAFSAMASLQTNRDAR